MDGCVHIRAYVSVSVSRHKRVCVSVHVCVSKRECVSVSTYMCYHIPASGSSSLLSPENNSSPTKSSKDSSNVALSFHK